MMTTDDERRDEEGALGESEFELGEEDVDLDTAMREALEVVERDEADARAAGAVEEQQPAEEAVEAELADLRERHVRALADFDNFRKRTERERREDRQYANFEVLRELLPVVDNLDRALRAEGSVDDLKEGVRMILRQLEDLMAAHGVEKIPSLDQPFDPSLHEAVSRSEDAEAEEATVIDELHAGYRMRGRLLRPAAVRVRVPAEAPAHRGDGGD